MAEKASVASLLNKLADPVFVAALSSRDKVSMSELVEDYFCGDPETDISDIEEEEEEVELGKSTLWSVLYKH